MVRLEHLVYLEIEELPVVLEQMVLMVQLVHLERMEEMDFLDPPVLRETEDCKGFQVLKELLESPEHQAIVVCREKLENAVHEEHLGLMVHQETMVTPEDRDRRGKRVKVEG